MPMGFNLPGLALTLCLIAPYIPPTSLSYTRPGPICYFGSCIPS